MLTPTPFSLFCALLLCLPLAVVFTFTTPTTVADGDPNSNIKTPSSILRTKLHSSTPRKLLPLPKDDDSLLRLAAGVDPNPTPPAKIAFLFLTTIPLPFAPLWERFFKDKKQYFNIYIHADPTRLYDPPFTGVFAGRVIHSKPSKRLTPSLISAARRLLAHALLHDTANAVFTLLSPSCIPLHSFDFTYKTLTRSGKSFIEILGNETGARDRWAVRGEDAMLPEVKFEDFRIGSQFWSLTRRHARMVVSDRTIWPKFNRTCLREDTCYPEENYFPTLIHMRDPRGAVPATLTHVDWSVKEGGHPRMYGAGQVGSELIEALRNRRPRYGDEEGAQFNGSDSSVRELLLRRKDPLLFARKFSPESVGRLMEIAAEAILRD